jgi:hypothetical protein
MAWSRSPATVHAAHRKSEPPQIHHIERRGDENQFFHHRLLLRDQPGQPSAERVADDRHRRPISQQIRDSFCVLQPLQQTILTPRAARVTPSAKVEATEAPAPLLTPLRQRLALVAPPLGEKPGDEEKLAFLADDTIAPEGCAVCADECERIHPAPI